MNTPEKKVVGQLTGANWSPTHRRFALEVVFDGDNPVRVADQFAAGRKMP